MMDEGPDNQSAHADAARADRRQTAAPRARDSEEEENPGGSAPDRAGHRRHRLLTGADNWPQRETCRAGPARATKVGQSGHGRHRRGAQPVIAPGPHHRGPPIPARCRSCWTPAQTGRYSGPFLERLALYAAARGAGELRSVAFALVAPDSDAAGVACRHAPDHRKAAGGGGPPAIVDGACSAMAAAIPVAPAGPTGQRPGP